MVNTQCIWMSHVCQAWHDLTRQHSASDCAWWWYAHYPHYSAGKESESPLCSLHVLRILCIYLRNNLYYANKECSLVGYCGVKGKRRVWSLSTFEANLEVADSDSFFSYCAMYLFAMRLIPLPVSICYNFLNTSAVRNRWIQTTERLVCIRHFPVFISRIAARPGR